MRNSSKRIATWLAFALLIVAILGWLDYMTGTEFRFATYYLVPISIAAWYTNLSVSLFIGSACVTAWFLANYIFGVGRLRNLVQDANAAETVIFFLLVSFILAKLRQVLDREKVLARTDPLTGAANLRAFYERMDQEMARGQRYGHPFSLVYIDVDDFKIVNDTLGHKWGDKILELLVKTIQAHLRSTDMVARLGGDEFAIILPEADQRAAGQIAQKLQTELRAELRMEHIPVTVSMGAITCLDPTKSVNDLIRVSDSLLYQAKANGKDQIGHIEVQPSNPPGTAGRRAGRQTTPSHY